MKSNNIQLFFMLIFLYLAGQSSSQLDNYMYLSINSYFEEDAVVEGIEARSASEGVIELGFFKLKGCKSKKFCSNYVYSNPIKSLSLDYYYKTKINLNGNTKESTFYKFESPVIVSKGSVIFFKEKINSGGKLSLREYEDERFVDFISDSDQNYFEKLKFVLDIKPIIKVEETSTEELTAEHNITTESTNERKISDHCKSDGHFLLLNTESSNRSCVFSIDLDVEQAGEFEFEMVKVLNCDNSDNCSNYLLNKLKNTKNYVPIKLKKLFKLNLKEGANRISFMNRHYFEKHSFLAVKHSLGGCIKLNKEENLDKSISNLKFVITNKNFLVPERITMSKKFLLRVNFCLGK